MTSPQERRRVSARRARDLAAAGLLIAASPQLLAAPSGAVSVRALDRQVAARTGTDPEADAYPHLAAMSAATGIRVEGERWAAPGGAIADHLADVFALIRGGLHDPRYVGASRAVVILGRPAQEPNP